MSKEHEKALVVEEKSKAIGKVAVVLETESTALRELIEEKDPGTAEANKAAIPTLAALRELTGQLNMADQPVLKGHLFELMFEQIREGLILADFEGVIQLANPAAHRIFRYGAGELRGALVETLVAPELLASHRAGFANARLNPRTRVFAETTPLTGIAKDGTRVQVYIALYPIITGGVAYISALMSAIETKP